jgi:hypothetical protein
MGLDSYAVPHGYDLSSLLTLLCFSFDQRHKPTPYGVHAPYCSSRLLKWFSGAISPRATCREVYTISGANCSRGRWSRWRPRSIWHCTCVRCVLASRYILWRSAYAGEVKFMTKLTVHAPQWCIMWINECNVFERAAFPVPFNCSPNCLCKMIDRLVLRPQALRSICQNGACAQHGLLNYTTVTNWWHTFADRSVTLMTFTLHDALLVCWIQFHHEQRRRRQQPTGIEYLQIVVLSLGFPRAIVSTWRIKV